MGGDYKIPVPPFGYDNSPVSLNKKPTYHYQFNVAFGYSISKNIGISVGAGHSSQGQEYFDYSGIEKDSGTTNTSLLYSFSKSIKLSYVSSNFQLHYNTSENKPLSFTCYIGIYYAHLLKYTDVFYFKGSNSYGSISQTDTATGNSFHDIYKVSFPWVSGKADSKCTFSSRPYKSYDVGQMMGIGIQKKLSSDGLFFFMINYQLGFVNIKNVDSEYSYNNKTYKYYNFFGTLDPNQFLSFKNSIIGISIGLKIKIKVLK